MGNAPGSGSPCVWRPHAARGLLWVALSCAAPALAQEETAEPTIVVTGERVPRTVEKTASSVVIFPEVLLVGLPRADRLDQLLLLTPNIQVGSGSEGPAIRGQDSTGPLQQLGNFLGGTRPRATTQLDGRPLGYNEFVLASTPLWDVRQVEIFRSPQTTTQGRNSIAGAIFIETNDPAMAPAAAAQVRLASNDFRQVSAMVNLPVADDQLSLRLAGDLRQGTPSSHYLDAIPEANINQDDYSLLRAKLLVRPARLPDLRVLVTYAHTETHRPQYVSAALPPYEARKVPRFERTNGIFTVNADTLTSRIDLDLSPRLAWRTILAFGDVEVQRFSQPGLGRNLILSRDYFVETRLDIAQASGAEGVVGLSWLGQEQKQQTDLAGLGLGTGSFDDWQGSLGVFGEASVHPVADVTLTAGVRYQRDRQDRQGMTGTPPMGAIIAYEQTFDAWLPKFVASWTPRAGVTMGALVQRAFNPGGTSLTLSTRRQTDFAAETLWNYELFARARSSDGRWAAELNLFRLDMRDNQRTLSVPITLPDGTTSIVSQVANTPRARSQGLEAGVSFRASDMFNARIGIGLLDTRIVETLVPTDPTLGREFQRAPEFSGTAALDWRPVSDLTLSAQARGWSSYFSDDANREALKIDGGAVVDVRLAWRIGRVTASAWARNLFDRFYLTYLFPPVGGQPPLATLGEPREFGVGMEARF